MHKHHDQLVAGWLFTCASLLVGVLILIDPVKFVSSPAWQTAVRMAPGDEPTGRILLGVAIVVIAAGMGASLIAQRHIWVPFIAGSLWFLYVTVALVKTTFTAAGGGTPGFVVWGILGAAALMNYGVAHIPPRA